MPTSGSGIVTKLDDCVLNVQLDRPKVNAITIEMVKMLQEAIRLADREDEVRCVLISAAGDVFSAGQDMLEIKGAAGTSFRGHLQRTYNPLILQIRRLPKPVLAAVNGAVSGAALGIVLACDLRVAAENARFVVGFTGVGLAPDSAISLLLPAMVGLGRAGEFTFTNAPVDAQQALALGLVNRVVPAAELDQQAQFMASALAHGPVHAMGLAKRAFNKAILDNLEQVLDYEAHMQDIAAQGDEHRECVQAFLEKRLPVFYNPK